VGGHGARLIKFGGMIMNQELRNKIISTLLVLGIVASSVVLGYKLGIMDERMRNYEQQIEVMKSDE